MCYFENIRRNVDLFVLRVYNVNISDVFKVTNMLEHIKCPICGTEFEGEQFDECPYCQWGCTLHDEIYEEDAYDDYNMTSRKEAREKLKNGLTLFGHPLPERAE